VFDTLTQIRELLNPEDGQAIAEFALILGFIALVCIAAMALLGTAIIGPFMDFIAQSGFGGS
jgi:Flp pilus assembly pilin Flp